MYLFYLKDKIYFIYPKVGEFLFYSWKKLNTSRLNKF